MSLVVVFNVLGQIFVVMYLLLNTFVEPFKLAAGEGDTVLNCSTLPKFSSSLSKMVGVLVQSDSCSRLCRQSTTHYLTVR